MSFFALAKIDLIEESSKGYTKLALSSPVPWRTRHLIFFVWQKSKLYHGDEMFKVDDAVGIEYRPGKFDRLVSMELARVDICPVCYSLYELPPNAQKIDCGLCSIFDTDRRERAPAELKLIAITYKQCAYSKGCCLTFVDEKADVLYFSWTLEAKPYFEKFGALEPKQKYNIYGWILRDTDEGNFAIELNDVPDICV